MKKYPIKFISVLILIASLCATMVFADDVTDLRDRQSANRTEAATARSFLEDAQNRESAELLAVAELDAQLDEAESALAFIESELAETESQLSEAEDDLNEAVGLRERQYEAMKARIRYMYENSPAGYLRALLSAGSFADLINRFEYVGAIIDYDKEQFANMKATEARVADDLSAVERRKADILTLKARQEVKIGELNDALDAKHALVEAISADETAYSARLRDLDEADKQITEMLNEAIRAAEEKARKEREEQERLERERRERERIEREAALAAQAASQSANQAKYTGGALSWPVTGYYELSSGYGSRTSPIKGTGEFHTGIDIPAPTGTPIYAAAAGTVVMARYNGGYGYCVVIDHGGGLSTLYGHNSKLIVSEGDYVERGQQVAKCGSTGYSTGPHCHFEVRLDGKHTAPLPYVQ